MISGEFHTLAMFLGAFSAKKKLDNYHSWWFADDQDGNHKNLYDEKQNSGGENSTGRKDNQLSELEQLSLLLVLDDPHNQDGHTFQDTARNLVLSQKCYWWFCCFFVTEAWSRKYEWKNCSPARMRTTTKWRSEHFPSQHSSPYLAPQISLFQHSHHT